MAWTKDDFISLDDLYVAYRKAKVDAFYERNHISAVDFANFEKNLPRNLATLLAKVNAISPNWMIDLRLIGSFKYIPKSIEAPSGMQQGRGSTVNSNPDQLWKLQCTPDKAEAKFRLVGRHSVEFHIISALWLQKVGYRFDAILGDCVYGTRIKRKGNKLSEPPERYLLGSLFHYSPGFRRWRSRGIDSMESALKRGQKIAALTADVRSFYHEVSADFLLSDDFLSRFRVKLSANQRLFTSQYVTALQSWAANTPEHGSNPHRGLPVGLAAPRVIANVLLHEFDEFVQRETSPLYYGRYVDDVLLVLDNYRDISTVDEFWSHLISRSNGLIQPSTEDEESAYRLSLKYSPSSSIVFAGKKQKLFTLSGRTGLALLNTIGRNIAKLSSEWRMLPDLPSDEPDTHADIEGLAADFLASERDSIEEVDNLRKSDGVTVKRLSLAIQLRNFESARRALEPAQWRDSREEFYSLAIDHVLTAPGLFAYSTYIPRLVALAVACGDWNDARRIVVRIGEVFALIRDTSNASQNTVDLCQDALLEACLEAATKALISTPPDKHGIEVVLDAFQKLGAATKTPKEMERTSNALFNRDLGYDALRESWIDPTEITPNEMLTIRLPDSIVTTLSLDKAAKFLHEKQLWNQKKGVVPIAIAFPTRPLTTAEITLLDPSCINDPARFFGLVKALMGREVPQSATRTSRSDDPSNLITVPLSGMRHNPIIALPALLTKQSSWNASVSRMADPDAKRFFRINRLINGILNSGEHVQYVVLPELALPRRWFNAIAHRLCRSGISLIAGLEYAHWQVPGKSPRFVSNQVRAALLTNVLGYNSMVIYQQEKERAAPEEARSLQRMAGISLRPRGPVSRPIIQHGDFRFGLLICSELTNIELRAVYRGNIDALFVPEWNQDINSFSSLVESAALDMHCFVVQINNRQYGDCRVRAPYKEEFRRDVARIKGGLHDYFVLAEIDVQALRSFQSSEHSPDDPEFKPKPDGYILNRKRRVLPSK